MVRLLPLVAAVMVLAAGCRSIPEDESARLERITLAPREARCSVGEARHLTAIGHYAGGATRNLTQRLTYTSSDPTIASAPNVKGDRSRIETLAPGTVTISARDPATGVGSEASAGDTRLTILGALERITLAPSVLKRAVGDTQRLTATGHYAGGGTRNLTQHVVYRSSDPAVAAAPNAHGDKSRIDVVGTGTATISAVEPKTGLSSSGGDATITAVTRDGGG